MKVALIAAVSDYAIFQAPGEQVDPPLGLLHLATTVKDRYDVRIFDGQILSCTPRTMADEILAWKPDIAAFSVNFSTVVRSSREIASHIRSAKPEIPIIFGGNYSTFHWERLIKFPYIDHVIEHFGIDRVMFGSDWPVCMLAGTYQQVFDTLSENLGQIGTSERSGIFSGNARTFYKLN